MSTNQPGDGPTAPSFAMSGPPWWQRGQSAVPSRFMYQPMDTQMDMYPLIPDAETGVEYCPLCVECHLRTEGVQHTHNIFGLVLDGQVHRAWFNVNTFVNVGDPDYSFGSWSISERDGDQFLRLTIGIGPAEPELKTIVWKLTDETLPDRPPWRLGKWPD